MAVRYTYHRLMPSVSSAIMIYTTGGGLGTFELFLRRFGRGPAKELGFDLSDIAKQMEIEETNIRTYPGSNADVDGRRNLRELRKAKDAIEAYTSRRNGL